VLFILQGPGGRWQRLVQARQGVSVAVVTLPSRLAPGRGHWLSKTTAESCSLPGMSDLAWP
jgi:predicted RNA-binding protein YlxR (DUF448 family)